MKKEQVLVLKGEYIYHSLIDKYSLIRSEGNEIYVTKRHLPR